MRANISAAGMTAPLVVSPREPVVAGWIRRGDIRTKVASPFPCIFWEHVDSGLRVLSSVEVAEEEPGHENVGACFHVSISKHDPAQDRGVGRCDSNEARWVLAQFNLSEAEEDNHVPHGRVRNFWRPVADRLADHVCPCKASEPAIVEDGGDFVWRPAPPREA